MTTFNLDGVRNFTASLKTRMERCDNDEGSECTNADDMLRHYAALCGEYSTNLREWGRAIFAGHAPTDPEAERIWQEDGEKLYTRAVQALADGRKTKLEFPILDGHDALQSALWELDRLIHPWVSPKLAVGPGDRNRLTLSREELEKVRQRIASLPPMPANWEPSDPHQRARFRRGRR